VSAHANTPSRILAQALMKRAVAGIPIVTHVQKESGGMNRLYAQSMCSSNQWRAYQGAESMVAAEVDEVRAEADEIDPGWSQMIWRQAMQYHQMLKQKHEMKAAEEQAKKKKEIELRVQAAQAERAAAAAAAAAGVPVASPSVTVPISASSPTAVATTPKAGGVSADEEAERIRLAEKAAEELIKMEEREKESKKAFSSKGMKKGFLDNNKGKKKK
jgi:Preprotein translocase subunit Sec66